MQEDNVFLETFAKRKLKLQLIEEQSEDDAFFFNVISSRRTRIQQI